MVFSMANGFDRMLKQTSRQGRMQQTHRDSIAARTSPWRKGSEMEHNRSSWDITEQTTLDNNKHSPTSAYTLENQGRMMLDPKATQADSNNAYHLQPTPGVSPYENWDFQHEELWT
jgi:hypothetical protein